MKIEFETPQIKITVFSEENVITTSITDTPTEAVEIKTTVNGKAAASYGAVDVSIFDI